MGVIQLPEVDTGDEITADENFLEFALLITFPWKRRIFHDRANYFEMYDDRMTVSSLIVSTYRRPR